MLRTLSDLLAAFSNEEAEKLAKYKISHGPTIGAMYEGLSSKVLEKAIPPSLDLQVVSGFITDHKHWMSGQIDCMLVKGKGESIPHTSSFKWPIWDVLAVFEVKKTLFGQAMQEGFLHLRTISHAFSEWLHAPDREDHKFNISRALNSFSRVTGLHAPSFRDYQRVLSEGDAMLYYSMVVEQLAPIRIVLGYDGFKTEEGMRKSMIEFLREIGSGSGFGVNSFPHVITCNGFSLCKANGQPYWYPLQAGKWHFYMSSAANPLWLMLEHIWTKIENVCEVELPWEDDLVEEVFHPLLSAQPIAGARGWYLEYSDLKGLARDPVVRDWQPTEVTPTQQIVLNRLVCDGTIDITNVHFLEFLETENLTLEQLIRSFDGLGLISFDGAILRPTIRQCAFVFTPDGKIYAGEHQQRIAAFLAARRK